MYSLFVIAKHAQFVYDPKTHVLSSDRPFTARTWQGMFKITTHTWREQQRIGPRRTVSPPELSRHEYGYYEEIYAVCLLDPFDIIYMDGFGTLTGHFQYLKTLVLNDVTKEYMFRKKLRRKQLTIDTYRGKVTFTTL